jgi:uncharacterized protein (TIGR02271 family)
MTTQNDVQRLLDLDVYESDGTKIGSTAQVYLDRQTSEPTWISVKTGLFGTKETLVPLERATLSDDRIVVPYGKDQVKNAPRIEPDDELSPAEEEELFRYYSLSPSGGQSSWQSGTQTDVQDVDRDRATDTRTGTDDAMTRSEEKLVAGTRTEEAGRARLRKYVVTERQQVEVPVQREEVRLEREPITDANVGSATDGPAITESEHDVTLHAERPVVQTEAVPVERVRLGKETVQDTESVEGEVRKEQIDYQGPDTDRR